MNSEEFTQQLHNEGFGTVVKVEREPNGSMDLHSHPFEAKALILEGEITISAEGKTRHCLPGDVFQLAAYVPHTESYGPQGVSYLAGRK